MTASKNPTELLAYLATAEVTPNNVGKSIRDLKDTISQLTTYITEYGSGKVVLISEKLYGLTLNKRSGSIVHESLTAPAGLADSMTLFNDRIYNGCSIVASISYHNGNGLPIIKYCSPAQNTVENGAGSATILIYNAGEVALSGTTIINFIIS
jgi:hypothetical protein